MSANSISEWIDICDINVIPPFSGVAALVCGEQVAIFRLGSDSEVYAISNYDPFSQAYVMSRGIVGDRNGVLKVASPIYKQSFSLVTGDCLDDSSMRVFTLPARVINNVVQVGLP
jgi:nitrite reductase (NADH) small subunit